MLGDTIGYRESFRIEAMILFVSSLLIGMIKNDEYKEGKFRCSFHRLFAKEAAVPAVLIMLVMSANFTITSFVTLFGRQMNVENIGIYFMANALILTLVRPIADRISERIGTLRLLPVSLLCLGLSLVLIAFSTHIGTFLLASAVNAFGYGTSLPIIEALCLKSVTRNRRALASATNSIGSNLGILLGPIVAGAVRDISDYRTMFITMTLPVVVSIVTVYKFKNRLTEINKEESNGI
ncbi:MAG: MFS transporter, partial [Erysipelotrichaceae bacterium]|nr:MFS transporter [Erysipelotrichaceae bacterium]